MAVMLFHIEGNLESLVCTYYFFADSRLSLLPCFLFFVSIFLFFQGNIPSYPDNGKCYLLFQVSACSSVDLIIGVLGWSMGCSWPSFMENHQFLEC